MCRGSVQLALLVTAGPAQIARAQRCAGASWHEVRRFLAFGAPLWLAHLPMSESSRAYPRSKSLGVPALPTVSSLRSRARTLASSQLRGAAEGLLKGALGKLEERVRGPASRVRSSERMREVLERDRALAFAAQPASAVLLPSTSPEPQRPEPAAPSAPAQCAEPIRTRTMARLLAAQGHRERALSIYAHLLQHKPDDQTLLDELAALRASPG